MSDVAKLATEVMNLGDQIKADYPDCKFGEVLIVVELRKDTPEGAYSGVISHCSDARYWVQLGMLRAALINIEEYRKAGE